MLSYLARQSVLFYPFSVVVAIVAAGYCLFSGRWDVLAGVVIVSVLNWFTHLIAKGWIRASEDNDIREWMHENPDPERGEGNTDRD